MKITSDGTVPGTFLANDDGSPISGVTEVNVSISAREGVKASAQVEFLQMHELALSDRDCEFKLDAGTESALRSLPRDGATQIAKQITLIAEGLK